MFDIGYLRYNYPMHKRSAFIITLIFGLTSIANIAAQIVIARVFGISLELDAFLIAVAIPTMIVAVAYASINDTFLPQYSTVKHADEARTVAGSWVRTVALIGASLSLLFFLFPREILTLLFSSVSEHSYLYLQILAPACFFGMLSALFMSVSYSHKHFVLPPLVQLVGAVINIALIWFLFPYVGGLALPLAFVGNYVLQFLIVVSNIRYANVKASLVSFPQLLPLFILFGTYLLMRTDTLLLRFASVGLGTGGVSLVNYSARMMSMPSGLITSGIKVILLPLLAETVRNNNTSRFSSLYTKAILFALLMTTIAVVTMVLISLPLLNILFVRGKFTFADAIQVNTLIPWFIPAALGWGLFEIASAPFFAVKKYVPVALTTAFSFAISLMVIFLFKSALGVYTAAVATGILMGVNTISLLVVWQVNKGKYMGRRISNTQYQINDQIPMSNIK